MHIQTHRVALLILSTLLSLSFADYLSNYNNYLSIPNVSKPNELRGLGLQKRAGGTCRTLCSAKSCCQPPLSDSDDSGDDSDDSDLTSRSLEARTLFPDDTDAQTLNDNIVQPFTNKKVALIYTNGDESGASTSNYKPITEKTSAFNLGLSALCGCTALIVYSQNGIYGAHFFEDVAWGEPGQAGGFQTQVEDFLTSTTGATSGKGGPGTLSLAQVAGRLTKAAKGSKEPATVAAYILAPMAELPDDDPNAPGYIPGVPMYEAQLSNLVALLPKIIPALAGHIETTLYEALEGGVGDDGEDVNEQQAQLLDNTARGRVLAQYDPQNGGFREVRLFFETNVMFSRRLGNSVE